MTKPVGPKATWPESITIRAKTDKQVTARNCFIAPSWDARNQLITAITAPALVQERHGHSKTASESAETAGSNIGKTTVQLYIRTTNTIFA
jgi:hypothetical protein